MMIVNHRKFQQNMLSDPDNSRRRRFIIIIGWASIAAAILSALTIPYFADPNETIFQTLSYPNPIRLITSSTIGSIMTLLVLWLVKKDNFVVLSGILLTGTMLVLIVLSDDFSEVAGGRSTIFLAIPILISAIVIRPLATFVVTAICTLILLFRPGGIETLNLYAILAMWMLSLAIWLATSVMERAIRAAQKETQRVRAMLGIVSHELRTPLGSISGYSDMLMLDKSLDELQSGMLVRIKEATLNLIDLVNRLLDSAHIQSGKMTLKPTPVTSEKVFMALTEHAEQQANNKGLKFRFEAKDVPDVVVVDLLRLQQIVINLLDNAIKFTEHGAITLVVERKKQNMVITVADTGAGISRKDIPTLFQEFTQAQDYVTREYGGVGLGLSIVYNLVNMMKGVIVVDSKVGVGTTVTITIPLCVS